MFADIVASSPPGAFRSQDQVRDPIRRACRACGELARYEEIGTSEEGRPICAAVIGNGPNTVSLLAGAHSDEPVGPETLRTFILEGLARAEELTELWDQFTFVVIPHMNPDGEVENRSWTGHWPDPEAYLLHRFRELPGRDLEFGYPSMRPENEAVASFLREHAPFVLHMSLHGMAVSQGGLLLIERHWIDRTTELREKFRRLVADHGLDLHDHDRGGEKGFVYIGPGFSTTPEGRAMTRYFLDRDEEEMASKFHQSSMEFVRGLGGDPLCLVTEFPLFVIGERSPESAPGRPVLYLKVKDRLPELTEKVRRGETIDEVLNRYDIRPLPLDEAVALQLRTIELGLETAVNEGER